MPLESGKSKAAFSHNVATEMKAGKPQKQAVAIAYAKQRGDANESDDRYRVIIQGPTNNPIDRYEAYVHAASKDEAYAKGLKQSGLKKNEVISHREILIVAYKGDSTVTLDALVQKCDAFEQAPQRHQFEQDPMVKASTCKKCGRPKSVHEAPKRNDAEEMPPKVSAMLLDWLRANGGDVEKTAKWMRDKVRVGSVTKCRELLKQAMESKRSDAEEKQPHESKRSDAEKDMLQMLRDLPYDQSVAYRYAKQVKGMGTNEAYAFAVSGKYDWRALRKEMSAPAAPQSGHSYSAAAVQKAIEASNRAGRRIGGKEARAIHALLKGRHDSTSKLDAILEKCDSFDGLVKKLERKGYSKKYATGVAGKVANEKRGDADDKRANVKSGTNAKQILILARKHIGKGEMESSARLCLAEAVALYDEGDYDAAKRRALKSLAYSVGILHPDYKRADSKIFGHDWEDLQKAQQRGNLNRSVDTKKRGDYGADPLGDGQFRMVPSGDIVDLQERNRRLSSR